LIRQKISKNFASDFGRVLDYPCSNLRKCLKFRTHEVKKSMWRIAYGTYARATGMHSGQQLVFAF
jgi:hypothetical protein